MRGGRRGRGDIEEGRDKKDGSDSGKEGGECEPGSVADNVKSKAHDI